MYSQGCVLDITEWAECVGGELAALPPDAHDVLIELSEVPLRPMRCHPLFWARGTSD
jgi:hypothetical protein